MARAGRSGTRVRCGVWDGGKRIYCCSADTPPLPDQPPAERTSAADPIVILHTFGSSSGRKAVALVQYAAIENAFNNDERQGLLPDDQVMVPVPMFSNTPNARKSVLGLLSHNPDNHVAITDLARAADVLIEGFRPGVMGLDPCYERLSAADRAMARSSPDGASGSVPGPHGRLPRQCGRRLSPWAKRGPQVRTDLPRTRLHRKPGNRRDRRTPIEHGPHPHPRPCFGRQHSRYPDGRR